MINAKEIKKSMLHNVSEAKKGLDKVRLNITLITEELEWLDNSPMPIAEVNKKIDDYISANGSSLSIGAFFYNRQIFGSDILSGNVALKHGQFRAQPNEGWVMGSAQVDISHVICALFPDVVSKELKSMAQLESKNYKAGPPVAERPELKKTLLEKKRVYEIEEEQLICQAEELGLIGFFRRPDVDPEIVLMVT